MTIFVTTTTGDVTIAAPDGDGNVRVNVSNPELEEVISMQRKRIAELEASLRDANEKLESRK